MNQVIAAIGFPLITIIFYGLGLSELKKALQLTSFEEAKKKRIFNRVMIALVGWVVFVSAWSLSGIMQNFSRFPMNMLPVLAIPFVAILVVTFSKTTKEILTHVEPQSIIRLQSFRIFVELV